MNWNVVVTTAPREKCTLDRTIQSLLVCGWMPTVVAEPGSTETWIPTIQNTQRLGVWHNWISACRLALAEPSDFILTVQDDCHFHPDSKALVESIDWPSDAGFVSLYTPKHYQHNKRKDRRPNGFYEVTPRNLWGSLALVFRPDVLREIVDHPIAQTWIGVRGRGRLGRRQWPKLRKKRQENPHLIQNSDVAIGRIVQALGRKMYYFNPSPVSHVSEFSTCGHAGNTGRRNAEFVADVTIPLMNQIFTEVLS